MIKIPQVLRYPGSKNQLLPTLLPMVAKRFEDGNQGAGRTEYIEPFFGGGSGLAFLYALPATAKVWINDLDPGIYSLWQAVRSSPDQLKKQVRAVRPSVDLFYELKADEIGGRYNGDVVTDGVRKIALHRMSVSGYGSKSGGPLGGRHQSNKDSGVDCRWNPADICYAINRANRILRRFGDRLTITRLPALDVVGRAARSAFVYLDPPYVQMGAALYSTNMSHAEHETLANELRTTKSQWLLSYDDCAAVRQLYSWADCQPINITYSNRVEKQSRARSSELLIRPKPC
jgi:DNA adenine methylase